MKIICIGRNYALHAKEMNSELPTEPVFFMKPDTAILPKKTPFYIPEFTQDLHHEIEIVLKICKVGKHISKKYAHTYYDQIGLGIDFTARDLQQKCKEKGLPWEMAKSFDNSAPISEQFIPVSEVKDVNNISFSLMNNNKVVQTGNTSDLIFTFEDVIAYVSQFITLKIGDLIFTGTPAGVAKVSIGDHLEGFIEDKKLIDLVIK
jgi:2-keto-4-pentenoate hydratase/2-oxohepta-3-ene-1,7-dioic acid hydratase in catechol pathway